MHPACSLHGCLTLQIPRDDPGNESRVSTCNSGTGWVDQMAVGSGHWEQPSSYSSGCPETDPALRTPTPWDLSLHLPVSATGENLEARHSSTLLPESGNHSPSLCWLLPGTMWPAGVPPPPRLPPRATPHLVQPPAVQQGGQLVEAGLGRVQQELDSKQIFLKQEEADMRTDQEGRVNEAGRACG